MKEAGVRRTQEQPRDRMHRASRGFGCAGVSDPLGVGCLFNCLKLSLLRETGSALIFTLPVKWFTPPMRRCGWKRGSKDPTGASVTRLSHPVHGRDTQDSIRMGPE